MLFRLALNHAGGVARTRADACPAASRLVCGRARRDQERPARAKPPAHDQHSAARAVGVRAFRLRVSARHAGRRTLLRALTSAPRSTRACTASRWPLWKATCSGVLPSCPSSTPPTEPRLPPPPQSQPLGVKGWKCSGRPPSLVSDRSSSMPARLAARISPRQESRAGPTPLSTAAPTDSAITARHTRSCKRAWGSG